jgi:hypothetical protein
VAELCAQEEASTSELPDWASALDVLPFATTALYASVSDMDGIPKYPIQGIPIPKSPMGPMGDLGTATPAEIVAIRPIKVGVAVAPHCLL